jgi:2-polyprenyl-3-methyl-5-hydroxy-6-metoxy-1,4-benzoquinol methylase
MLNHQNISIISKCIICNSNNLSTLFSAENICLTGYFPLANSPDPLATPITLLQCNTCFNVQMRERVNPNLMFKDYWYRSGTTKTMIAHLRKIAVENVTDGALHLDIGCNDGTLMKISEEMGADVYGVEPSSAHEDLPVNYKDKVINDFFNLNSARNILKASKRKFDLVTVISVFYDVEDPLDFLTAIKEIIADTGKIIIEVNYAKSFFDKQNIDMLGQEHLIYYFIKTFSTLCSQAGLYLNDAYLTDMNGGNITFTISKKNFQTKYLIDLAKAEADWFDSYNFNNFNKNNNIFRIRKISLS